MITNSLWLTCKAYILFYSQINCWLIIRTFLVVMAESIGSSVRQCAQRVSQKSIFMSEIFLIWSTCGPSWVQPVTLSFSSN
ncbi:uncharacterized protein BDR25DRAFT_350775 [Lindgomyces ingoldianus]|uniref:Uncharacterized protein n=1 Tax=Lindgomyces ingoldianus TaxID=673940 RepID=A0ACB6RAN4_9PLEO|nr:uncharacterized protein BDR25DRAFT_350775 [Lindgomyces ingoldianus]KAF2475400.1 hypothetical protein BDR25DRAFT_350775 [Lindgomyces ingoldianus]